LLLGELLLLLQWMRQLLQLRLVMLLLGQGLLDVLHRTWSLLPSLELLLLLLLLLLLCRCGGAVGRQKHRQWQ